MEKLKLIIYREFLTKVRNKSFVILTFLSPFLLVAMGVLVFYLTKANDSHLKEIVLVDESHLFFNEEFLSTESIHYIDLTKVGLEKSKELVEENNYDGLLYIPSNTSGLKNLSESIVFYSSESANILLIHSLEEKIANKLKFQRLKSIGIDAKTIRDARFNVAINQVNFKGAVSSKLGVGLKIGLGMTAGYLIMMFIVIYGTSVMRSVIEEKSSRVIEVIISSVKPFQLLLGKIIGNTLAGLLQFVIWGILILVFGLGVSLFFGIDILSVTSSQIPTSQFDVAIQNSQQMGILFKEVLELPLFTMFVLFLFYFIGGFFLYSSIYASIGAAVDSETDTQQFMLPVVIPLVLAVYVGFAAVISDPHGPVATSFSMIPFTSPIVMLMRIPFGVPWYEIGVSLVLLILTFIGMVALAAKIYKVGILMYGKKPTYKDLYKWLKY
tara:strand:- start:11631 stop:12947 length:1317 start_codon:yes stop_codon:yes gene_type:complete